jgi:hypothetical protein
MSSHDTIKKILPEHVYNDLIRFITCKFQKPLPNSLLIAQAFILQYPDYGNEYGLPVINYVIEEGIKQGLF